MNSNDLFKAVMQLDLEPIKMKLMHVASGEGWSLEKADAVEKEYRRFLCLMKIYPEEDTAPLVEVDTFWHYHILDTMKYAEDCEKVFGTFVHHFPYFGMRGEEDAKNQAMAAESMHVLEIFGWGVDKWRGLRWLADQRGLDASQVAVIGDEVNDVAMLESAGCGIAMGNAIDAVKAVADRVTLDHHENGVGHAIQKLLSGEWG